MGSTRQATTARPTVAETMHRDAVVARVALARLLGWNLPEREREAIRAAAESVDVIDRAAVGAMRAQAEAPTRSDIVRAQPAADRYPVQS